MKLYIYPKGRQQDAEVDGWRTNTTPLSEEGLKKHCEIVPYEEADYYYIGQLSCGTMQHISPNFFEHLDKAPHKHIAAIEGDWGSNVIPDWGLQCILFGNENKSSYNKKDFMTRPVMSPLLLHFVRNYEKIKYNNRLPNNKSFGFRGQTDPHGTRLKVYNLLKNNNIPHEILWNPGWGMIYDLKANNTFIQDYSRVIVNNIFSLCPRGVSECSIRIYETCFFGRIPIIIGNTMVLGDDYYDTSFMYKIDPTLSDKEMLDEFNKIYKTPVKELHDRCQAARNYFKDVVIKYYEDPTLFFINFLKRHKL